MNFKYQIIDTGDGSKTIYLPHLDETYHSHHGALKEARHIFVEAGLHAQKKEEIAVLEIGFGTGLNAIVTIENSKNRKIQYDGIELFPLSKELIDVLGYKSLLDSSLGDFYDGLHAADWNMYVTIKDGFELRKIEVDFTTYEFSRKYDLIYFDAFAPNKQEEMWTVDLFERLYQACNDGAILVTYCVKGVVKRALKEVGFEIEKLPGPKGGKREMLRAWKRA